MTERLESRPREQGSSSDAPWSLALDASIDLDSTSTTTQREGRFDMRTNNTKKSAPATDHNSNGESVMKRHVFSVSAAAAIAWLVAFSGPLLANNFVTGASNNGNVLLDSDNNWDTIRSVTVTIPSNDGASHGCVVSASADMENRGGGIENKYRFVITHNDDSPDTDTGSERILELADNSGVDDPDSKPVSTTRHFTGLTNDNGINGGGGHTFYFLGRKAEAVDADADVLDASLTVICVDTP